MKKWMSLLLVLVLCLSLCACGSAATPTEPPTEPPTEAPTEEVTEVLTEPLPDIILMVDAPADWQDMNILARNSKSGVEELVMPIHTGTYEVPGWTDRISIICNDGAIRTDEYVIEPLVPEMGVYIHAVNEDYVFVHNEGFVDNSVLIMEKNLPLEEYHNSIQAVLEKGGYQVAAAKAVAYDERYGYKDNYADYEPVNRYCKDYIPAELLAETAEEIYYVLHIYDANEYIEYSDWQGKNKITAVKPGIRFEIWEIGTNKVLVKSEPIMGGDPPQVISEGQSARGEEPSEETINAWIEAAFEELASNPPEELPMIP